MVHRLCFHRRTQSEQCPNHGVAAVRNYAFPHGIPDQSAAVQRAMAGKGPTNSTIAEAMIDPCTYYPKV